MNMRGIPRYTLVWGARHTLGARYLSKNTVHYSCGQLIITARTSRIQRRSASYLNATISRVICSKYHTLVNVSIYGGKIEELK